MSAHPYYVWGADWTPLSIHLSVQVIDAINSAISAGMRADPDRGLEIGGILLGGVEASPDSRPIISIQRFDPVDVEHRRGPSYVFTERDRKVLGRKLAWWSKHAHKENLQPVGLFRTHTRRGLYLDNDDFVVIREYFPDPESVFLLVRPVPGADSRAGFFFWQDGDIHREATYEEFPFNSAKLPLVNPAPPVVAPSPVVTPAPPASVAPVIAPSAPSHKAAVNPLPPRTMQPRTSALPAVSPPKERKPMPVWLRLAVPLAVGMALGAVISKVTTTGISRPAEVAQTKQSAPPSPSLVRVPAPAEPAASAGQPSPASPVVEKPSPLQPKSRPVLAAGPVTAANPPKREVAKKPPPPAPTGSAARAESGPATSAAISHPAEPAPVLTDTAPPPPPVAFAPITSPVRVERPRAATVASVTVEPVSGSKLGRMVRRIPGLRGRNHDFVPARPIRQITPSVPAGEHLEHDVPVDLKIRVDPAGSVADVEQTSHGADQQLVRLAENAARSWQFVPARRNDETVSSELILHFMFKSTKAEP